MTPERLAVQDLETSRRRPAPKGSRGSRLLLIAVGLSLLVHLLSAGVVILLSPVRLTEHSPSEQGAVELLMVEQKGAEPSQPGQTDTTTPQAAEPHAGAPNMAQPEKAETMPAEKPAPTPPARDSAAEPVPPPPSPSANAAPAPAPEPVRTEPPPSSRKPAEAPVFDFAGTDSDTNATVLSSSRILPAMPDDRFRNRPPAYPAEAARRGETGSVLVVIHVAPNGYPTGAEVAESSGSDSLDRAAVAAVRKWRFRPAMKAGVAVPFDMPFRFVFSVN
ncbi:MAG: energy transducer TonB [Rhodopila sp.]